MPQPAKNPTRLLPWVQALRALAALCVAFLHIAHDDIANGGDPTGTFHAITQFFPWDAGVDIFFVISGFVIVHASANFFAKPGGPAAFLRRRLARIIPLYWLMTTAFLAVLLLTRDNIHGDIGGPLYLAASYFFIPWPRPDGVMQPAFGLGWTLNYEMFFYLLFTPCLCLSRNRAVPAAAALLIALVALAPALRAAGPQLTYWSDPVVLEFIFGMAIAELVARGVTLPLAARLGLVILALAGFHLNAAGLGPRPLIYGLPAAALVLAAALAPAATISPGERLLVRLGDASYAMYLVHPFIMRGFTVLWHKFHAGNELAGTIYVFAGLAAAQICALAINATLERKFNLVLRRGSFTNEVV